MIVAFVLASMATCGDLPNQTSMNECQIRVAEREDAQMNVAWRKVREVMRKADAEDASGRSQYMSALLSAQRAWLAFRNAECEIQSYEWKDGTMQPFTRSQCMAELARARSKQLTDLAVSIGR